MRLFGLADDMGLLSEKTSKWHKIDDYPIYQLEDHHFYLIAVKGYGTAMKGKFHDDAGGYFSWFDRNGEHSSYLFENGITHWAELIDLPGDPEWYVNAAY